MFRPRKYESNNLTAHRALPKRWAGYTASDWAKIYGFFSLLIFGLTMSYVRYLQLFDDWDQKGAMSAKEVLAQSAPGLSALMPDSLLWGGFIIAFSLPALLLFVIAALGFIWWAAGALVEYSRWQTANPRLWRIFWVCVLLFYAIVEFDPLDNIHPQMSLRGLAPAPNLIAMFDSEYSFGQAIPMFQFQWGYFILWALFWFLLFIVHWQYMRDGMREIMFVTNRVHRYMTSVVTGFRTTAEAWASPPVTRNYPHENPVLPESYRGTPKLIRKDISDAEAQRIVAADASGSITAVPGQPKVLMLDLGQYHYSAALEAVKGDDGQPLLEFSSDWPKPAATREELIVPLAGSTRSGGARV